MVPDSRHDINKRHLLIEIVVITLAAYISVAEGWNNIETFGRLRESRLRKFLELPNGIPSHETIS